MPWKRRMRYRLEYFVFRLFICMIQAMSVRQSVWFAHQLANMMTHLVPKKMSRCKIAKANLKIAFGDEYSDQKLDEIIHGMWLHLFRMVVEIAQLPRRMRLENSRDALIFRDRKPLIKALATGRPVIMLSGHFGNWEMAMSCFGVFGYKTGVIARVIDNPWLHQWFKDFRQMTGHKMVLKRGGYDEIVELMDKQGFLGIACDQDAGSRGLFVDFFGKPASTFKSIALLALEYDAILSMGYARRMPDDFVNGRWVQYEIGCEELIDPREIDAKDEILEITRRYTSALERVVRYAPEQYFWVHRRWKSEPRKRVRKKKQLDTPSEPEAKVA